jgi:hypothetical protein
MRRSVKIGNTTVTFVAQKASRADRTRYALSKLHEAAYELATNPAAIRDRLIAAWSIMIAVFPDDFPRGLRPAFLSLQRDLKRLAPKHPSHTRVQATVSRVRLKTCSLLAARLCALADDLDRVVHPRKGAA